MNIGYNKDLAFRLASRSARHAGELGANCCYDHSREVASAGNKSRVSRNAADLSAHSAICGTFELIEGTGELRVKLGFVEAFSGPKGFCRCLTEGPIQSFVWPLPSSVLIPMTGGVESM
jgi:hypothetical protein